MARGQVAMRGFRGHFCVSVPFRNRTPMLRRRGGEQLSFVADSFTKGKGKSAKSTQRSGDGERERGADSQEPVPVSEERAGNEVRSYTHTERECVCERDVV